MGRAKSDQDRRRAAEAPITQTPLGKGDMIRPLDKPAGATTVDQEYATQMEASRVLMKRWYNVLRELAK